LTNAAKLGPAGQVLKRQINYRGCGTSEQPRMPIIGLQGEKPMAKNTTLEAFDAETAKLAEADNNNDTPAHAASFKNEAIETNSTPIPPEVTEELDAEEAEFRSIRRDLPGVKGSSGIGIVAISVGKTPAKNEFFRTLPDFRPVAPIVDHQVGMDRQYFAVSPDMVTPLGSIGISVTDHTLYFTSDPVRRAIPTALPLGRRGSVSLNAERMLLECTRCGEKIAGRPGPFDPRRIAGVWSLFGG
jgi:hypothetical protein